MVTKEKNKSTSLSVLSFLYSKNIQKNYANKLRKKFYTLRHVNFVRLFPSQSGSLPTPLHPERGLSPRERSIDTRGGSKGKLKFPFAGHPLPSYENSPLRRVPFLCFASSLFKVNRLEEIFNSIPSFEIFFRRGKDNLQLSKFFNLKILFIFFFSLEADTHYVEEG